MLRFIRGRPKQGVFVRLCSPLGQYPVKITGDKDHSFFIDDDLAFSLVRCYEVREPDTYYSEVDWAHSYEIRFFASLALARNKYKGAIIVYPLPEVFCPVIPKDHNLSEKSLHLGLKDHIKNDLRNVDRFSDPFSKVEAAVFPPCISGLTYRHAGEGFNPELQRKVLIAIDPADHLLIRGLSTLIRSQMLNIHNQFLEESIITLFVSLESSFRLVLRHLKQSGISNPTGKDASRFIDESFNNPYRLDRYFEEYYDRRVMAIHPESRFGCFPHAPLQADDFYCLHEDLREVYLFLLTGYIESP